MNQQVQVGIFFPRSGQTLYVNVPSHTVERLKADSASSHANERTPFALVQRTATSFGESAVRPS